MNTAKQMLYKIIEEIPGNGTFEVIDFIGYLKMKREKELYKDLENASESSLEFWINQIDDEVWNKEEVLDKVKQKINVLMDEN